MGVDQDPLAGFIVSMVLRRNKARVQYRHVYLCRIRLLIPRPNQLPLVEEGCH